MGNYLNLSDSIQKRIIEDRQNHVENPYAFKDEDALRRNENHDRANLWRPTFVRDIEKIMHIPYYNRYMDKTQVFSLYKNDDISRRASHVQLVARIARNIGRALNLNLDLIEAIALGHDIGHTPFGHAGEHKLNELYHKETGRYFHHNIQSARVLDVIFPANITLQTLDGIICHNGEMELKEYRPVPYADFAEFDKKVEACYLDQTAVDHLVPATLEACVVRVSDIIAYLGKDRQDAIRLGMIEDVSGFADMGIGKTNAEIINNMIVNLVEHSYGKPYLQLEDAFFEAFAMGKRENYETIYGRHSDTEVFHDQIYPMFDEIYQKLLQDVKQENRDSVIYRHHIDYIAETTKYYANRFDYASLDANDMVMDFISSMTDDYFVDLYTHLFPEGKHSVSYKGYFEEELI